MPPTLTGKTAAGTRPTVGYTDHLGTTVAMTNEAGEVVWSGETTPFGEQVDEQGALAETEDLTYTGKDRDPATVSYYFNARWYDAELGRFITEDPARDGGNWYLYVGANPLGFVDPSGLISFEQSSPFATGFAFSTQVMIRARPFGAQPNSIAEEWRKLREVVNFGFGLRPAGGAVGLMDMLRSTSNQDALTAGAATALGEAFGLALDFLPVTRARGRLTNADLPQGYHLREIAARDGSTRQIVARNPGQVGNRRKVSADEIHYVLGPADITLGGTPLSDLLEVAGVFYDATDPGQMVVDIMLAATDALGVILEDARWAVEQRFVREFLESDQYMTYLDARNTPLQIEYEDSTRERIASLRGVGDLDEDVSALRRSMKAFQEQKVGAGVYEYTLVEFE